MLPRMMIFVIIITGICGCSHQYPLLPEKETIQSIQNVKITYILPKDLKIAPQSISGLFFKEYDKGPEYKTERLHYNVKDSKIEIQRRTDNGVAGSGTIYETHFNVESKINNLIVTLTPVTKKNYQQGLVLPFPIPLLDIEPYLKEGVIEYEFETESIYPPDAVRASLQRLLGSSYNDRYTFENSNALIEIEVKIYPYRDNRSKIVTYATIQNRQSSDKVIDFVRKINDLKQKIKNIIDS